MKPLHEYAFDVKLFAAIRVTAPCAAEARKTLRRLLASATVTAVHDDGSILTFDASLDDSDDGYLFEIDGETT